MKTLTPSVLYGYSVSTLLSWALFRLLIPNQVLVATQCQTLNVLSPFLFCHTYFGFRNTEKTCFLTNIQS